MEKHLNNNCVFIVLFLFSFFIQNEVVSASTPKSIEEENGPFVISEAVQGTLGKLLCNVTPPVADDSVALVIWYKEGHSKPIYSFDTRNSNFAKGTHWVEENLSNRASFDIDESLKSSAVLKIKATKSVDSGVYRCRVDFQKSPTRNSRIQLKIIVPPEKLVILDDTGNHIPHYILGPYNEGTSINITCVSTGGRPLPNVTWWYENNLLSSSATILSERRVSNVLHFSRLERKHLNQVLTCQAANNNLTAPITSAVTVDLNLRPLTVQLRGDKRPLSADSSYKLDCIVTGSRPAPTITWWKGSTPMRNTRDETTADGNITTSTLTFTPTIEDRGKFLSCRAEQTLIPESGMEDGWKLDIYHIPVVTLEYGTNLNTSTIREGADVFFECNIKSNPWVYRVSWRHNGNMLDNNLAEGIIVANQSLVLQNVSRARSGLYTCVGSNREGDGESNPVQLDIRFAPICRPGQKIFYSSGRQETKKIICEVEANPTEVSFVWKFNVSSMELVDIPASHITTDHVWSIAHYTPMTEHDYGTLLCWASNEIGSQTDPCLYTITPAGEPDPPINCSISNQTSNSFQVECIEGFDGGLAQNFVLEIYVNGSTRNPKIYQSKSPFFDVRDLTPGVVYNVFLVAQNTKGRSNSTILQVYTLKNPEKQTDLSLAYVPVIENIRPFIGVLLSIVGSIFLIALIIVIVVRLRGSSGRDRHNFVHQISVSRDTLHNDPSIQDIGILRESYQGVNADGTDRNPDIIPQDEYDEDEWIPTKHVTSHSRSFTTAALAEQSGVIASNRMDEKMPPIRTPQISTHKQNYHAIAYNNLVPGSKMSFSTPSNQADLNRGEFNMTSQVQRICYSGGTFRRSRPTEIDQSEPAVYTQLAVQPSSTHYPISNPAATAITSPSLLIQSTSPLEIGEISTVRDSAASSSNSNFLVEGFSNSFNPVSHFKNNTRRYL